MDRCDNDKIMGSDAGASSNAPDDEGYTEFLLFLQSPSPGQMKTAVPVDEPVDAPDKEEPFVVSDDDDDDSKVATKQEDDPTHPSSSSSQDEIVTLSNDEHPVEKGDPQDNSVKFDPSVEISINSMCSFRTHSMESSLRSFGDSSHSNNLWDSNKRGSIRGSLTSEFLATNHCPLMMKQLSQLIVPQDYSDTDSDSDTEGGKDETLPKFNAHNNADANSQEKKVCGDDLNKSKIFEKNIKNNNGDQNEKKTSVHHAGGSPNDLPLWKVNFIGVLLGFIVCLNVTLQHYSAVAPTKPLFNLPLHAIGQIDSDLVSIDIDKDGKIDANELRNLLEKHDSIYTEDEIVELSEIFYASDGIGGMPMDDFLATLDGLSFRENGERFKTRLYIGTGANEISISKTHDKYTMDEDLDAKLLAAVPTEDKLDSYAVRFVRTTIDVGTGWAWGKVTKDKILNRAILLETLASIPGRVPPIIGHFRYLRNMAHVGYMLNKFIEQVNNERMHLLTLIQLKDPGPFFRAAAMAGQAGFGTAYLVMYMISPALCNRFVRYIQEEARHTYAMIIEEMENSPDGSALALWRTEQAPDNAKGYWNIGDDVTVFDVIKAVAADGEGLTTLYDPNDKMDKMFKKYLQEMMKKGSEKARSMKSYNVAAWVILFTFWGLALDME